MGLLKEVPMTRGAVHRSLRRSTVRTVLGGSERPIQRPLTRLLYAQTSHDPSNNPWPTLAPFLGAVSRVIPWGRIAQKVSLYAINAKNYIP